MKKKITYATIVIFIAVAIWYFFVKQHDYQISFKAYHPTGLVYQTMQEWNYNKPKKDTVVETVNAIPYHSLEQSFVPSKDSLVHVAWELEKVNDTTTQITGYFTADESSALERAKLLFTKTDFVNQSLEFTKALRTTLQFKSKLYKIAAIDTIEVPAKKYIYVERKTTTKLKARGMIADNGYLMGRITWNKLKLVDYPFVEIQSWDQQTDSISLKFCFPIEQFPDSLSTQLKYEERAAFKGLRIRYNGNFSRSHFAWYAYDDYFKTQGKKQPSILPTEIYLDNPNEGGEEIKWRADIVLPLTQIQE
jgi:hypothetical protein